MNRTRIAAALGLAILLLAMICVLPPQTAHAQCDPAGGPCPPAPGEKDKKRATPTSPTLQDQLPGPPSGGPAGTLIAAPTALATIDPNVYATARACWDAIYRTTPHPELPTASWGDIQGDAPQCIPTSTPTPGSSIFIPPVAGPVFVLPGVKNVIIAVLIIGVLLVGAIILVRRFHPPSPNKPPNPNKPPGPPS